MANQFTTIFNRLPKRNKFNLSFENKLTAPIGKLIPVCCQEVIPGDKFKLNLEHVIRFQPMVAPILQRMDVYFHAFFVPNRLLWKDWETFITGGENGTSSPAKPTLNFLPEDTTGKTLGEGTIYDFLNFPTIRSTDTATIGFNPAFDAMPFRAYAKIYNDYYRDQNLEDEIPIDKIGFEDISDNQSESTLFWQYPRLLNRSYKKDYFTSALPEPQRGPDISLPINGTIRYDPNGSTYVRTDDGSPVTHGPVNYVNTVIGTIPGNGVLETSEKVLNVDNSSNLTIKGESATIADFRRAFKVQEWQEKMSRGGARYVEQILNFFGVRSSDARLQRAEYLGGISSPVSVSAVTQTSQTNTGENASALGDFAGHAMSVNRNKVCSRYFEEHGFFMVIMSVIPRSAYFQGLPRKYTRLDKTDYYWPQFAHIGEQEIKNQEIFFNYMNGSKNTDGFGYSPRYAEYRFNNDEIHGEFRTNLEFWHMARKFGTLPPLNKNFMEVNNSDVNRVFAVNQDKAFPLLCDLYFDLSASRLISRYGNPRL